MEPITFVNVCSEVLLACRTLLFYVRLCVLRGPARRWYISYWKAMLCHLRKVWATSSNCRRLYSVWSDGFLNIAQAPQEPIVQGPQVEDTQTPFLCTHPKHKRTLEKRELKRITWYRKKISHLSKCPHCGVVSRQHTWSIGIAGNQKCTGECLPKFEEREYPPEYRPPC